MKDNFIPLADYKFLPEAEMLKRSEDFYNEIRKRRTVREFSDKDVPSEVIKNCIKAAGTAPNGANLQPWHFVIVRDKEIKRRIRKAAEEEENEFYKKRAPEEWLEALAPLGTDENKPFLEKAPYLIVIFSKSYDVRPDGTKVKQYYSIESTGIAAGVLITALHHSGLATLTHTPSPMGFLNEILERPSNEKPFLILVAGYPAKGVTVPDIKKKSFDEITSVL
jgi:iodotyrosine deiodinase